MKPRHNYTDVRFLPMPKLDKSVAKKVSVEKMRGEVNERAAKMQKRLRSAWGKITPKQNIIIVTGGDKVKGEDKIKYIFELNQLNLKPEEIKQFKTEVDKILDLDLEAKN